MKRRILRNRIENRNEIIRESRRGTVRIFGVLAAAIVISIASVSVGCTTSSSGAEVKDGWNTEKGKQYWYESGIKQGVKLDKDGKLDETYRGKEIYDKDSDAWYWLDNIQNGAKTVSKDVYQESLSGDWGDIELPNPENESEILRIGKWVRYDTEGKMIKGWCQGSADKTVRVDDISRITDWSDIYYFDLTYGTMAKGYVIIDGNEYFFNPQNGKLERQMGELIQNGWKEIDGKMYWYEEGVRQGVKYNSDKTLDLTYRGKEIYDPESDAWYWLDNVQEGAKAVSKDVYQESLAGDWGDVEISNPENESEILRIGKWVRYDAEGQMIKGWQMASTGVYFFDLEYGAMVKSEIELGDGKYYFNSETGKLESFMTDEGIVSVPEYYNDNTNHILQPSYEGLDEDEVAALDYARTIDWGWPSTVHGIEEFYHAFQTFLRSNSHGGVDISDENYGDPILAAANGIVEDCGWSDTYGNFVYVNHGGGVYSLYAHHQRILVETGEYVSKGQQLGEMGSTGFSTSPHLHFAIVLCGDKETGTTRNPYDLIPNEFGVMLSDTAGVVHGEGITGDWIYWN